MPFEPSSNTIQFKQKFLSFVKSKLNVIHEFGNMYPIAFLRRPAKVKMFDLSGQHIEIQGASLRLRVTEPFNESHKLGRKIVSAEYLVLERLDEDGEWKPIPLVQSFKYEVNLTDHRMPLIQITTLDHLPRGKDAHS